jgi:hypothetical protein
MWSLVCGAVALFAACIPSNEPQATDHLQAASTERAMARVVDVSTAQIDDVRFARWQAWDRLATDLPDGHVLSVELLHSRPGRGFAAFTIVRNHHALQSVVAAQAAAGLPGTDGLIVPESIPLGEPPPKEPPDPGIVALGAALLDTAFREGGPVFAMPMSRVAEPAPVSVSEPPMADVRMARWQDWQRLAADLPDGYVLAVELLQSHPGDAIAVFTTVRDRHAVQSVVTPGGRPRAAATSADVVTAEGMPLGSPPDKEPPDPGVIAAGSSLLQITFDLSEHAVDSPPT